MTTPLYRGQFWVVSSDCDKGYQIELVARRLISLLSVSISALVWNISDSFVFHI